MYCCKARPRSLAIAFLTTTLYGMSLAFLALPADYASAQPYRERLVSVTKANFDSGGEIGRQFHLHAESYLPMTTIARTTAERRLDPVYRTDIATAVVEHRAGRSSLADYASQDPLLDGLVIVHRGQLVFERYPQMRDTQRHFAWSVSKMVAAVALASLAQEGQVAMDAGAERYVPALANSAWAGIPLQHIVDMASGIDCLDSDGYQDKQTCVYRMEESLGITAPTGRDRDFMAELLAMQMHRESGRVNEYVSANTNVLMLVIETVTGKPYAQIVEERIWAPMGAESDALLAISPEGFAYASGGLQTRLRDVARFGLLFTDPTLTVLTPATIKAMQQGGVLLPEEDRAARAETLGDDIPVRAAWQWDEIWDDGTLYKSGYSGQGLYVDPARDLVAAWFGTGFNFDERINEMLPIMRQLVAAGLFDASP